MFSCRLNVRLLLCLLIGAVLVAGCSSSRYSMRHDKAPEGEFDFSSVPDAQPKWEPLSRQGNAKQYTVLGKRYSVMPNALGYVEEGVSSWYGLKFHGELTSNGERYNMYEMSAAHKTLPIPTYLKVTNLENQKTVVVRVNDRGPFHEDRIIDLSFAAANRLGFANKGTARVKLEAIVPARPKTLSPKPKQVLKPAQQRAAPDAEPVASVVQTSDRLAPFVQVAAFSGFQAAQTLRDRLARRFPDRQVFVASANKNGKAIHRVRLGPLLSQDSAVALRREIQGLGIGEPIVITRSVLAVTQ